MKRTISLSAMLLLSAPAIAAPDTATSSNIEVDQSVPMQSNIATDTAQQAKGKADEHASKSTTEINDVDECPSPKLKAWWTF
ncbi:MAG: hypothetical protein Q9M23_00490 [Mariprofundaceae bacterium]|nr:hypothetical protein [Mariprofundaceae bacterium]